MGKTHTAKEKERSKRLAHIPRKDRLAKQASIKKKEGRVLNADEKHAMKMTGDYGTIMTAWEELRSVADEGAARGDHAKKEEKVAALLKLILPSFESAARTPRMSRVIQSCLKHGSGKQLQNILVVMSKNFVAHSTDPYAHFTVCALLRHSNHELFRKVLNLILSNMSSLIGSKFGVLVIHTAYGSKMCTATDRNIITLGVFKDSVAVMRQWKGYPILEDILEQEDQHKTRLVKTLFALLDKLVSQKEAFGYPFVQRLLCAFFTHGGKEEIQEIAISLKPHVGVFCDSREGSMLAAQVVSVLPPKQRKEALQSFKDAIGGEGIVGLCCAKYSAPVIARLFDLVYDGQILWKYISGVMSDSIEQILSSPYAHMVVLHLLTPDADRKGKALLPGYSKDYNLFSRENKNWNQLTWLDADGNPETVEICNKPAESTHAIGLQQLLPAIAGFLRQKTEETEVKQGKAKTGSDLFVARIAKEVVYLLDNDQEYSAYIKKAFAKQRDGQATTPEDALETEKLLRNAAPKQKTMRGDMEEGESRTEEVSNGEVLVSAPRSRKSIHVDPQPIEEQARPSSRLSVRSSEAADAPGGSASPRSRRSVKTEAPRTSLGSASKGTVSDASTEVESLPATKNRRVEDAKAPPTIKPTKASQLRMEMLKKKLKK